MVNKIPKEKQKELPKQNIAITIQTDHKAGMKPTEIANLLGVSKQRVNYWIHHKLANKRKRRTKLTRNEKNYLIKWAKDRPLSLASAKKIQRKFNSLPKRKKEKKLQKKISVSTVNRILNKYISKPKQIKKVFFLSTTNKNQRLKFLKFMKRNDIDPSKIFFTDESIFNLGSYFNRNYKIRLSKETQKQINRGDELAMKKITRQFHKKENGLMVSGGICKDGLGKLIFHSGNVNSFSYNQVLHFYKEDLEAFPGKYFQQDGARAHSSKKSQKEINNLFGDKYIPTWDTLDNGPMKNNQKIPKWPPNSPDLSAIELIWSIIKGMMNIFPPTTIEELKVLIQKIWNAIPKEMCERIIEHIQKRWELCLHHKGARLDKQLLQKISTKRKELRLKLSKENINGVRISYNDKFLIRLKNKEIRDKTKKLKEQIKIENKSKNDFDKLMKLKPREYKNIPDEKKNDLRFTYEHDKARRELIEERLEEIKKMTPIEYLNKLNENIKQKLIVLCLNKKILELFENDDGTNYDENEQIDDYAEDDADEEEEEFEDLEEND